jgi:hypothetical protein
MFMERIEVPVILSDPGRPLAVKLAAGLVFLCLAAIIAPLWLAACAAWFGVGALVKGVAGLLTGAWRTTIWAGELVVGR